MRVWGVVLVAVISGACGSSSPTNPTPTPTATTIAGTWGGRLTLTFQEARIGLDTTVTLQQQDRAIHGTWTVTTPGNDIHGTITGTVTGVGNDTRFSGSAIWDSASADDSTRCTGTASYSGSALPSALVWDSPGVDFHGTCTDPPTEITWSLSRR